MSAVAALWAICQVGRAKRWVMKRIYALSILLLWVPLAVGGQEAVRPDFEIAQEAVARGQILPLIEVLTRVQAIQPGRVVEVELEQDDGVMVYEVELITPDGRLIEMDLDAATGALVEMDEEEQD